MKEKEYYKVLGISENATAEEIESAYKKLKKKYNSNPSNNNKKKLKELKEAYESLTKEETEPEALKEEKIKPEEIKKDEESILNKITKEQVIIFCTGLVLGLIIMMFFFPDRIAELKNGEEVAVEVGKNTITADDMYNRLKKVASLNILVEKVDEMILRDKYTLTEEDNKSISQSAQTYITQANQAYNMSEEDFIKSNGFESKEEFIKYLEIEYLRNKYYEEYTRNIITEDEINSYYNNNVYGSISTEHILVKTENSEDETAKSKANEILEKLKSGTSWDDLKNEYANDIVTESVTVEFDSPLESAYKTEAEKLKDGDYSSSLVKTSYGYHIVYRKSTSEKISLNDATNRIKEVIASEKQAADPNLYAKSLIYMRNEAGMDIKDTEIKKSYEDYRKNIEETNN